MISLYIYNLSSYHSFVNFLNAVQQTTHKPSTKNYQILEADELSEQTKRNMYKYI